MEAPLNPAPSSTRREGFPINRLSATHKGKATCPPQPTSALATSAVDANGSRYGWSADLELTLPTPSFAGLVPAAPYLALMDGEDALQTIAPAPHHCPSGPAPPDIGLSLHSSSIMKVVRAQYGF